MILGFNQQFKSKILDGSKIHTLREDPKFRWYAGRKIHFYTGVRTKEMSLFKEDVCVSVRGVFVDPRTRDIALNVDPTSRDNDQQLERLPVDQHHVFATNDGFEFLDDFWKWFDRPQFLVLINWTEHLY